MPPARWRLIESRRMESSIALLWWYIASCRESILVVSTPNASVVSTVRVSIVSLADNNESRKMVSAISLISIESRRTFALFLRCFEGASPLAITNMMAQSNRAITVFVLNLNNVGSCFFTSLAQRVPSSCGTVPMCRHRTWRANVLPVQWSSRGRDVSSSRTYRHNR